MSSIYDAYVWNPWHGCKKVSAGCSNCYIDHYDRIYGMCNNMIKKNVSQFNNPIKRIKPATSDKINRDCWEYNIPSYSTIVVCDMSDFFIDEAILWRNKAWDIMRERYDCLFKIQTKRPENIQKCLPDDWGEKGWSNIAISVSIENQEMADYRLHILLNMNNIQHKGIVVQPMLEKINIEMYLCGDIEFVTAGGESTADGFSSTLSDIEWYKDIRRQCEYYDVNFRFNKTGSRIINNNSEVRVGLKDERNLANFYDLEYTSTEATKRIDEINDKDKILGWKKSVEEYELDQSRKLAYEVGLIAKSVK